MINRRVPNIIVPLNKESEDFLYKNIICDKGLYYTFPISREDLDILQMNNFFEEINLRFNLNIDEYEEEIIESYKQKEILVYLKENKNKNFICDFYQEKLIFYVQLALKLKRSIFIYL